MRLNMVFCPKYYQIRPIPDIFACKHICQRNFLEDNSKNSEENRRIDINKKTNYEHFRANWKVH